jgi:hypothetical protein
MVLGPHSSIAIIVKTCAQYAVQPFADEIYSKNREIEKNGDDIIWWAETGTSIMVLSKFNLV